MVSDCERHPFLCILSSILGWLYVACWSVSFYPQIYSNNQRKSVTGLSCDYIIANFYGFLCYALFNTTMYFSETARAEYRQRHASKDILVTLNDVVFAVHATCMAFIFLVQYWKYRQPNEEPSILGIGLAISITGMIVLGAVLTLGRLIPLLDYLYALSYIKLVLTVIKCIPQAWLNFIRKSTHGFSIANVLLDFFGGILSISQLILDAFISGHLFGIFGYLPKLILGVISILFDVLFILQHYVWYAEASGPHLVAHEQFRPVDKAAATEKGSPVE